MAMCGFLPAICAGGHSNLARGVEFAVKRRSASSAGDEFLIGQQDSPGLLARFLEQFDAEVPQPGGVERFEECRTRLCRGVEKRVPAAHIRPQGMFHANSVPQVDPVLFAGSAAVRVVPAL